MSDARQAIAAARAAGATTASSPDFYAAEAAIGRAEKHLQAEEFTRARLAAMEAKRHAAAALANANTGGQHAEAPAPTPR
jgi:Tfp pilus assembly protein PilX